VTHFAGGRLYSATESERSGSSDLAIVALYPAPSVAGKIRLRGAISTLVPRAGSVVALGRTSSSEGRGRLVVHEVDVGRPNAPRLRGTATFGSDWTWSVAEDSKAAISFDPGFRLAAVPFTAVRERDGRYGVGTQLIDFGSKGPKLGPPLRSEELVVRAVFVGGRLLAIGPAGIETIDYANRIFVPDEAPSSRRAPHDDGVR
jgi:hypothetical protein